MYGLRKEGFFAGKACKLLSLVSLLSLERGERNQNRYFTSFLLFATGTKSFLQNTT